MFKTFCYI